MGYLFTSAAMARPISAKVKKAMVVLATAAVAACGMSDATPSPSTKQTSNSDHVASITPSAHALPRRASSMSDPSWQYVGTAEHGAFDEYVDANNITDRGGIRYAWIKTNHRTVKFSADGYPYTSNKSLTAYQCSSTMWAIVSFVLYSASGSVVYSSPEDTFLDWKHAVPGSMAATELRVVCDGERPQPPAPQAAHNESSGDSPQLQYWLSDERVPGLAPAQIFEKVRNSVWILVSFNLKNGRPDIEQGKQGSAVAVGPNTLLTNCHVLKGFQQHGVIQTEFQRFLPMRVKRADYASDRCVLESPSKLAAHVNIRSYKGIQIGEEAYSVGTPRGLELTIANGIISAKRNFKGVNYLQTTAPISPGSSGGGLFDGYGNLIGITTSFRGDGQNLNFAVAADAF